MIPVGQKPILWHLMNYYSQYGHHDFVLCLGYKSDIIKDFFLRQRPEHYGDCIVSDGGNKVELIGSPTNAWEIALIDTGVWRKIGERLWAVREHITDDIFLANYSDSLSDVDLSDMIMRFKDSGKIGCFLAVHPPILYHLADLDKDGEVKILKTSDTSDIWINGGFFIFRREIFDYMRAGEELVLEPFERLIKENQLLAYKYEGFWQSMDTLKDRQIFEDMIEQGQMPWCAEPAADTLTSTRPRHP